MVHAAPAPAPSRPPPVSSGAGGSLQRHALAAATVVELVGRGVLLRRPSQETATVALRRVQQLGPTFVKVAQFLSMRRDIIGEEGATVLSALRDRATAVPVEAITEVLDREGVSEALLPGSLDPQPLACASIAQVHRAKLRATNRDVIVKVKRPGVEAIVAQDIAAARKVIASLGPLLPPDVGPRAGAAIDEFASFMRDELDFRRELKTCRAFAALYADNPEVIVPRVHRRHCTSSVLTMDYEPSQQLTEWRGDRRKLAQRVMATFLAQLLYEGGIVHGDPHAGNIGVRQKDGKLVLYDFGSAVRIPRAYRARLKQLVVTIVLGKPQDAVRALQQLGVRIVDPRAAASYMSMYGEYMRTIDINAFRTQDKTVPFELDATLVRLGRAFGMIEGICKELNDDFSYFDVAPRFWDAFALDPDFLQMRAQGDVDTMVSQLFAAWSLSGSGSGSGSSSSASSLRESSQERRSQSRPSVPPRQQAAGGRKRRASSA